MNVLFIEIEGEGQAKMFLPGQMERRVGESKSPGGFTL